MSIKNASQSLTRIQTASKVSHSGRGDDAVYDSPDFDPYYNKVSTHFSDTEYTDSIMRDLSGNNWDEFYGATTYARSDSRVAMFNGPRYRDWCSRFDGDLGAYVYADAPHLRFGYQDFTIEFWIKPMRNHATQHYIMGKGLGVGTAAGTGWVIGLNSSYKVIFGVGLTTTVYTGTTTLLRDKWYHVAIQRTSLAANGLKIYIDGVAEVSNGQAAGNYNDIGNFTINRDRSATAATQYGGNITDIRIQTGGKLSAIASTAVGGLITVASTSGFKVNDRVVFNGTAQGGLVAGTTYYIKTIPSDRTFTISATQGGTTFSTTASTTNMTANVLTYVAATPVLPTAALDMSGTDVVYSLSMLSSNHIDITGSLTKTEIITRRIDSPFINLDTILTGHGSHCIGINGADGALKIYDIQNTNTSLRLGAVFTVEAWIYFSYAGNYQRSIFGKGAAGWTLQVDTNGFIQWVDAALTLTSTDTRTKIHRGGWYHIAAVREGSGTNQFKMYVNGLLAYTGTLDTTYNTDTTPAVLFSDKIGAATLGHYNGLITGIRWSNNAAIYSPTSVTLLVTGTDTNGLLTTASTSNLTLGMPITFTGTAVGGYTLNTTYYIHSILTATTFMVTSTRGGAAAVGTLSSAGTTMYVTLTPSFDTSTTSFIDSSYTTTPYTSLLIGTVGTGVVAMNYNSFIDYGTARGMAFRKGSEIRLPLTTAPTSRHGYSAWYATGAQSQIKAFPNASNPNDFTFGTGDFSIEMWINPVESEVSILQTRTILDTRLNYSDTGLRIRKNTLQGLDVLTSGRIILSTSRIMGDEVYTVPDSNKLSSMPATFSGQLNNNTWYHLCLQRINNTIALFINGRKVAETYYASSIDSPSERIILGNSLYSTSNMNYDLGWYGWISDVRVCKGSAAYGQGLTANPDSVPVPVIPLTTTTNCVLLTLCQNIVGDYSGRNNRVGYEQTIANGASSWEVRQTIFSPYSNIAFTETNHIPPLGGNDTSSGFYTDNGNILRGQTGALTDLSFINRMSSAWTIEFFTFIPQTGTYNRATPTVFQILNNSTVLANEGFQIEINQINNATATFGEIAFINRTSGVAQYLQTSGALAANGGVGYFTPNSWCHLAFVHDPTVLDFPLAIFCNGVKVATRAAFTPGKQNWSTNGLTMSYATANLRISNIARYSPTATNITIPSSKHLYDKNAVVLIDLQPIAVHDKTFRANGYVYACLASNTIKKFGKSSIRLGQGPETLTATNPINRIALANTGLTNCNPLMYHLSDFTIEMWASWRSSANCGMPFNTGGTGNFLWAMGSNIAVGINSLGYWKFQHNVTQTDTSHWVYNVGLGVNSQVPNTSTAGSGYQLYQSNIPVAQASLSNPNAFDHVVVMRKNNNYYWYINGIELAIMYGNTSGSSGALANTIYAPIVDLAYWDIPAAVAFNIGGDNSATVASAWNGWVQDVRLTAAARYDTRVIDTVPTMVHKNTKVPALPIGLFPTK